MFKNASSSVIAANAQPPAAETKYKGVRKRKWGKYVCEIRLPNSRERIWLGSYDTAEKAARAFDAALFCLRGHRAAFNFPDDPPDIAGGQSLSPAEIQAVAQQYGNSFGGGSSSQTPSSTPRHQDDAAAVDLIDCSFWEMLDSNSSGPNAGGVSDFGLFPEPGDHMYITPTQFDHHGYEEDNYYDHGNSQYNSNLWNF